MNYYYLIASLPSLSLNAPPPLERAEFKQLCEEQLTAVDYAVLAPILDGAPVGTSNSFLRTWSEIDTRVRNAVARHRAARLQVDVTPFLRPTDGFDSYTERSVAEALARPDPRDREMALDRYRWQMLESIAGSNPFSFEALLAYALQLMMVVRWAGYDRARGEKNLETAVAVPA